MVLGFRPRSRKASSLSVNYVIHLKEITPWSLISSDKDPKRVLIRWKCDDKSSGSSRRQTPHLGPNIVDGKISFNESFQISTTLSRESTGRSISNIADMVKLKKFHKKHVEFELYELKSDHMSNGKLMGRAAIDLADLGVPEKEKNFRIPISLRKGFRCASQPFLMLSITTIEGDVTVDGLGDAAQKNASPSSSRDSLSTSTSMDKDSKDTFSVRTSLDKDSIVTTAKLDDEDTDEVEIASFTDDDSDIPSVAVTSRETSVGVEVEISSEEGKAETQNKLDFDPSSLNENARISSTESLPSASLSENRPPEDSDHQACLIATAGGGKYSKLYSRGPAVPEKEPLAVLLPSLNADKESSFKDESAANNSGSKGYQEGVISLTSAVNHTRGEILVEVQAREALYNKKETKEKDATDECVKDSHNAEGTPKKEFGFKDVNTVSEMITSGSRSKGHQQVGTSRMHSMILRREENLLEVDGTDALYNRNEEKNDGATADEYDKALDYSLQNAKRTMEKSVKNKQDSKIDKDLPKRIPRSSTEAQNIGKSNFVMRSKSPQEIKANFVRGRSKSVSDFQTIVSGETDNISAELVKEVNLSELKASRITNTRNWCTFTPRLVESATMKIPSCRGESLPTPSNAICGTTIMSRRYGLTKEPEVKFEGNSVKTESDKINYAESKATAAERKAKQLETEVERLKGELREAALLEASVYSVVAEHEGSFQKVHTPARRLARFYIRACKDWNQSRMEDVVKNTVSGLIIAVKACGNDVPRLTFWWSNTIVLREVIFQAYPQLSRQKAKGPRKNQTWTSPQRARDGGEGRKGSCVEEGFSNLQETDRFIGTLGKIESWIHGKVIASVWWQTLTPYMQSFYEDEKKHRSGLGVRHGNGKVSVFDLGNHEQENFSVELWKKAFLEIIERLCPVRAEGHPCGCLQFIPKTVIEQCIARLDVAMLNAILRRDENDVPGDPLSDPISDPSVLPILSSNLSFGSGAQLKNAVGTWSRFLSNLLESEDSQANLHRSESAMDSKPKNVFFPLLSELSDLLMLPKHMLMEKTVKKEVCPNFSPILIKRILSSFLPDDFCPHPVPPSVMQMLSNEGREKDVMKSPKLPAPDTRYNPPSSSCVTGKIGDISSYIQFGKASSGLFRKVYTSDDELYMLENPLVLLSDATREDINTKSQNHHSSKMTESKKQSIGKAGSRHSYQFLREV